MSINFKVSALPNSLFESFLSMNNSALRKHNGVWIDVDAHPGYPCRVSLEDARIGERVLAIPFTHHDVDSPYKSSGPIFVRANAKQAAPEVNKIPIFLRHRTLSVRGFNAEAMMIAAEVVRGTELEDCIVGLLQDAAVEYIHIHNAAPGCFNCSVVRA